MEGKSLICWIVGLIIINPSGRKRTRHAWKHYEEHESIAGGDLHPTMRMGPGAPNALLVTAGRARRAAGRAADRAYPLHDSAALPGTLGCAGRSEKLLDLRLHLGACRTGVFGI